MDSPATSRSAAARKPLGFRQMHVEKKSGRAKLPSDFRDYLRAIGEVTLFLTFTEQGIAKLYPMQVWDRNEDAREQAPPEDAAVLDRIYFRAMTNGKNVDIDDDGRFVVPPSIRESMGIEDADVHLVYNKGVFLMYTAERYKQELAAANTTPDADKAIAAKHKWV